MVDFPHTHTSIERLLLLDFRVEVPIRADDVSVYNNTTPFSSLFYSAASDMFPSSPLFW